MITDGISVKEAAELYGLDYKYFLAEYCDDGGIIARLGGLRVRRGKTKRSIEVSRAVILALVERESHQEVA